ncbi:hypothetical protein [Phenylobacterium sp.]|uniref:hypothetical protein n=1 Tax=Phenylobacterium sp. TaxID=1871053 RepID=UPI00391B522B
MSQPIRSRTIPAAGLGVAVVLLSGCAAYGAADYGYAPQPVVAAVRSPPLGRAAGRPAATRDWSSYRRRASGHTGFAHLGGRRH